MKKVFFSWQVDRRDFKSYLYRCIKDAVEQLDDWEVVTIAKQRQGSQDIANRIITVLNSCDAVVSDVSIVGEYPHTDGRGRQIMRKTANPNVLYETGYAMRRLHEERVIMIASDETTVDTGDLPFDIRNRSVMIRNFSTANRTALTAEIKQILSDLNTPLESTHPVIFCEGISWQRTSQTESQSTFNIRNEEGESYLLESIKYAGWEHGTNNSLTGNDLTRVIVLNAPIPPFDTAPESIEFTVSRLGERYKITQTLNTSGRADERYNLDGVVPMPDSIVHI